MEGPRPPLFSVTIQERLLFVPVASGKWPAATFPIRAHFYIVRQLKRWWVTRFEEEVWSKERGHVKWEYTQRLCVWWDIFGNILGSFGFISLVKTDASTQESVTVGGKLELCDRIELPKTKQSISQKEKKKKDIKRIECWVKPESPITRAGSDTQPISALPLCAWDL